KGTTHQAIKGAEVIHQNQLPPTPCCKFVQATSGLDRHTPQKNSEFFREFSRISGRKLAMVAMPPETIPAPAPLHLLGDTP
ncbi:MAG TPA: hypothetical protein VLZ55_02535, partial [Rhodanobacter sp.]|nr:hypothetical protein [Rhodanobacter sp.]